MGAAEEILKLLRITPEIDNTLERSARISTESGVTIRFDGVGVDFGRGRKALEAINLQIKAGERVAVVGESGAGKSTLIHLLLGFVQPSSGTIGINDLPLKELSLRHWRRQVAWIGQHPVLFPGTIRENIQIARPDAAESAVIEASTAAGVIDFCSQLPQGMDTVLGEQGLGLSKGQAQRIALARAYLKQAPLLLLDEPTAGLDLATEQHIIGSALRMFEGRTVVMATHSQAAVADMDWVIQMEAGRIVEILSYRSGSPDH